MTFPSYQEQQERCQWAAETIADRYLQNPACRELVQRNSGPMLREKLYFCLTFLRSEQEAAVELANEIICNASYSFCAFSPMIALQILWKYRRLLRQDSTKILLNYVEEHLEAFTGSDMDYVGVNDNFPSMAVCTLILGGQLLGQPELCRLGTQRLKQFGALLTRRGVASEYNSPTYLPIQLVSMSEIAHLAEDEKTRKIALNCEMRLWTDFLGHLHPGTGVPAGPYSRAYMDDSMGHISLMRCTLYAVYGDALPANIRNTLIDVVSSEQKICVHTDKDFTANNLVWLLDTLYDCPEEILQLGLGKQLPYEFSADTEFSSSTDAMTNESPRNPENEEDIEEYAAGSGSICTYMTKDYALGTASHEFHNGIQTDSFHMLYRRSIPVRYQKDIRSIFCRYIVNEKEPHVKNVLLEDEGRKLAVQEKNSALILYKPKSFRRKNVRSLKLSVVIPVQFGLPDEIWLGDRRVEGAQAESKEPCSVYIKDGPVFLAFHPYLLTDLGRKAAVKLQLQNDYLLLSFYNYEGIERDFAARGFLLTGNGFAAEIRSQCEAGSFEKFRRDMASYSAKDTLSSSIHSRQTFLRRARYARKGLELECEYSPVSEGIKHISVNGEIPGRKKLQITGFPCENLPFCADLSKGFIGK